MELKRDYVEKSALAWWTINRFAPFKSASSDGTMFIDPYIRLIYTKYKVVFIFYKYISIIDI